MKFYQLALTTTLLAYAQHAAWAAPVEIATTGNGSWEREVQGTYIKNTKIKFSDAGKYTINLQDVNIGTNFDMLGASISSISSPANKYVDMVLKPDQLSASRDFSITQAGDYFLNIFSISDARANPAKFSLSVNAVPLPSAVIFLSSALMGLVAFMRRRGQQG